LAEEGRGGGGERRGMIGKKGWDKERERKGEGGLVNSAGGHG